jgi:biopolymer transport protein ExbB/TolQ
MGETMNLLALLENGLFALGQVLRFPVMALLWVCVAFALYYAGHCLVEFIARRRDHAGFSLEAWLREGAVLQADDARVNRLPSVLRRLLRAAQTQRRESSLADGGLEHLVAEQEEGLRHALNGPRALVKIGPSLGLVGTLIPMGSSLAALAGGNLQAMSSQMVVAFTTTIIGLATGTLAYAVASLRLAWVNASIREQRYLAERIAAELERA